MTGYAAILLTGMLLGVALNVQAEAKPQHGQKVVKFSVTAVTQPDGSVIDRLAPLPVQRPVGIARDNVPTSPEVWLARMLDATQNGLAAKNPELFAEWLDAVTEPHFMTALATVVTAPDSYPHVLGQVIDPASGRNWAGFVDPSVYLRWMAASVDPKFYQAVFNRLADPGKYQRWAAYPLAALNAADNGKRFSPGVEAKNSPDLTAGQPGVATASIGAVAAASGQRVARQQFADEWLQLPSPDPKTNPWLMNSLNYRY